MLEGVLAYRARIADSIAIEQSSRSFTFSELEAASNYVARRLLEMGVRRGDRVVTLIRDPLSHVLTFFGVRKVGAVLVPINPRLGRSFLDFVVKDVSPVLVIDDYLASGVKSEDIVRPDARDYSFAYEERLSLDETKEPAMILYTGGTTGLPKGAIIPESAIIWNSIITILSWGLTSRDCTVVSLPLYHTGGWNVLLLPLLLVGGRVVLPETDKFDPDWTIRTLHDKGCTIYMGVPTMLEAISRSPLFDNVDLSNVTFISGGGPLPPSVAERFFRKGYRVFQGYGLTEAGPNNFYISPERYVKKPKSVGKPLMFVKMKLSDDGELLIRGPHVFQGYWNRPEEKPFTDDGYLRTGDIFTVDEDGDFYFLDRKKDMIKTGGENVYSTEVEEALRQLPYVEDAAVFGVPDERWGEMVVAVVVRRKKGVTEDEVKNDLKRVLASYKVPKRVIFVREIPKTPVGKISKKELREAYLRDGFREYLDEAGQGPR
ncbi:MAG: class I adenylate-forming enzyme family protein [Acidilobus sp.]